MSVNLLSFDRSVSSINGIELNSTDLYTNVLNINGSVITNNINIAKTSMLINIDLSGNIIFNSEPIILFEQLTTNDLIVNNSIDELVIDSLTNDSLTTVSLISNLLEVDDLIVNNPINELVINSLTNDSLTTISLITNSLEVNDLIVNNSIDELTINSLTNDSLTVVSLITNSLEIDDLIINNPISLELDDLIINNQITSLEIENINIINSFTLSTEFFQVAVPFTTVPNPDITGVIISLVKLGGLYGLNFRGTFTGAEGLYTLGTITNAVDRPDNNQVCIAQAYEPNQFVTFNNSVIINSVTGDVIIESPSFDNIIYGFNIYYMKSNTV
jgi:hypothetical protein